MKKLFSKTVHCNWLREKQKILANKLTQLALFRSAYIINPALTPNSNESWKTNSSDFAKFEKFEPVEYITNHIKEFPDSEGAFFVANLEKLNSQKKIWSNELPEIKPFYAVKCNADIGILKRLVKLGTGFDCASKAEIQNMLDLGASPNDIIFAHPCKQISHIKYAREVGVKITTFDNEHELHKMKEFYPDCRLLLRIHVDDSNSVCQLGTKFGARKEVIKNLIEEAKRLELNLIGVSFHVGSGCLDANAYYNAIRDAKLTFEMAKEAGFDLKTLDIGGGFPGYNDGSVEFEVIAKRIRESLDKFFSEERKNSHFKIIAEPGRYFAAGVLSLATIVTSKRDLKHTKERMFYLNDGVYGSFNCLMFDHVELPYPKVVRTNRNNGTNTKHNNEVQLNRDENLYPSSLWGPTCDSMDCLSKNIMLPDLNINDWLVFENMGAYTSAAASTFNGFPKSSVVYKEERNNASEYFKKIRKMNDDFSLS